MTATEDPGPPLSPEAAATTARSDDLEHWLSDLRTEVAANPSGWIDAHPHGEDPPAEPPAEAVAPEPPAQPQPRPQPQPEAVAAEPPRVGRHRTPD